MDNSCRHQATSTLQVPYSGKGERCRNGPIFSPDSWEQKLDSYTSKTQRSTKDSNKDLSPKKSNTTASRLPATAVASTSTGKQHYTGCKELVPYRSTGTTPKVTARKPHSTGTIPKESAKKPHSTGTNPEEKKARHSRGQSEYSVLKRENSRAVHLIKTVEDNIAKGVLQTPKNLESYSWAKNTVKAFAALCEVRDKRPKAPTLGNTKRVRSTEEEQNDAKKHRAAANSVPTKKM